ncbi:hypothetical protein ACFLRX_09760 [Acidobacteriota bacterium]
MHRNHPLKKPTSFSLLTAFLFLSLFNMCGQSSEQTDKTGQASFQKSAFDFKGEIIFSSNFDGDNEIYKLSKKRC